MALSNNLQLVCPIRGQLTINKKSKDGLTATEESFRVEALEPLKLRRKMKRISTLHLENGY